MEKDKANQLQRAAELCGTNFSMLDRPGNYAGETYFIETIDILSEMTAAVIYHKEPTKKKAVFWFYYLNMGGGKWNYFIPTYSHLVGLNRMSKILHDIEQHNYKLSVDDQWKSI